MKNVLVLGVAALALVGCAKKEELVTPAPAADAAVPADAPAEPGKLADAPAAEAPAAK